MDFKYLVISIWPIEYNGKNNDVDQYDQPFVNFKICLWIIPLPKIDIPYFFSFPRFYFIGDDDLLQILGQASKPAVIQTHMKKLFAGIYNVNFDEENKHIVSMNSIEGESVPLKNKVRISNEVEHWLNELAKEMKGMYFFFNSFSLYVLQ